MALLPRILRSWVAPGNAVAGLRGMGEPTMLALLMGTMALYFVAQWPGLARAAAIDPSVPLPARLGGALLATLFLMPLIVMAAAAISALLLRLVRRVIAWPDARLALIWALAAATPAMLLAGLVDGIIGPGPALTLVRSVAGIAFLIIWGAGLIRLSRPAGVRA